MSDIGEIRKQSKTYNQWSCAEHVLEDGNVQAVIDDATELAQQRATLLAKVDELEARIERIKTLPDKWSVGEKIDNEQQIEARRDCADDLLAALEQGDGI